ncbi:hypothetical protein [Acetobacter aceti]|uniref:Uncharacterized protein n=1 Tax=Acetobacter aceti TaxID=435 RepID=A0A6S6PKZ9_ACEAC|nr:hypothetical protein [Acetobacter aceti]BCI68069.1 hypothetical protein AAJCM20276_26930 [Acetobacter aceti]
MSENGASKYPIVKIEWEDSGHFPAGWTSLDELPEAAACRCLTVGSMIRETDNCYTVALSVDLARDSYNGIMEIPKGCVTSVTFLSTDEKRPTSRPLRERLRNFLPGVTLTPL